jgi:hypothetical protein
MCSIEENIKKQIIQYLKSATRNKVVLTRDKINGIEYLNVGKELAEILYGYSDRSRIGLKANDELKKILASSEVNHPDYGKVIAISNVGILFDPMLNFNVPDLLSYHSQNNLLIIEWKGEITDNSVYFLTKEKGVEINISHLKPIVIDN